MSNRIEHIVTPEEAISLHGLFLARVKRTPDALAYRYFDLAKNAWLSYTWLQMCEQIARWQAALLSVGLAPGDRVAIMLRNCPQWVMFEQAAMSLGLVVVPLYTVDRPENIAYIINDAGVKLLLFENIEQWQALNTVIDQMACLKRMLMIDKVTGSGDSRLMSVNDWLPLHASLRPERERKPDEMATIMYTSGTTGKPKGVMLSHHNIVYNAHAGLQTFLILPEDDWLSFLPLSHAFERTVGYYMSMMAGSTVAYARTIPLLAEDLKFIRPTILIAVPRIFERIYNAIQAKLDDAPLLRRKLFTLTVDIGWDRFEYQQGRRSWSPKLLLWPLLKHLVADKVMAQLGGRLRFSISGGAALPPKVSRLFIALGLPLVQGYGLTETSPVASVNRVENNYPSSIGPPLPGIEVRIGDQNALLVKGPCNMLGYWHNPEATRAMIDADGWLNTGDTARISETGHIYITGRLKEIIVMSNGEKIPPANMEAAIMRDRLFDQVMVYGEAHPYLVALAVVNPERWKHLAGQFGLNSDNPESLRDKRVEQHAIERIADQIKDFPGYARVHRVLLLSEPWSIENGMMTPTLKIKRLQVVAKFTNEIKELYAGH